MIDPFVNLTFSMAANPGVYAVLLGSGISRTADIPTGWEIVLDLAKRLAAAEGDTPADPAGWYAARFGKAPEYSALMQALATTQAERRALLHSYIEPEGSDGEPGRRVPTAAHRAIARLVRAGTVRVIITTNFDRLLENALRDEGVEPTVVSSEDGVAGMAPLLHLRCLVIKVHGDYLDTRILNTDGELATYGPAMDRLLDRVFDEHGLLVCGWSGEWDPALRSAVLRSPTRRYPTFWAARREPDGAAADLLAARAGRWISIDDADSFFTSLEAKVEIQRQLARPHPLSLDVLAAAAKRFLADPRPRVRLGDLIQTEARTAVVAIEQANVLGQYREGGPRPEEFHRRVDLFESALQPIVRLLHIIGRWGDGEEWGQTRDLLYEFHRPSRESGAVLWNALGGYPAVLVWYGYGMGLAKAGRLEQIRHWLDLSFRDPYGGGDQAAVNTLFLWSFEGSREGPWAERLDGSPRNPFAEACRQYLQETLSGEFVSITDFTTAYERFELLATLRHLETALPKERLVTHLRDRSRHGLPSPVGKMRPGGFREAPAIIRELRRPAALRQLVEAGYFGGNVEWAGLALDAVTSFVSDPFYEA